MCMSTILSISLIVYDLDLGLVVKRVDNLLAHFTQVNIKWKVTNGFYMLVSCYVWKIYLFCHQTLSNIAIIKESYEKLSKEDIPPLNEQLAAVQKLGRLLTVISKDDLV